MPKYTGLTRKDSISINYLCNIRDHKNYNVKYFEERKYIVIRKALFLKFNKYLSQICRVC